MFTLKSLVPPDVVDAPGVLKSISEHFRFLNSKGALAINSITKWTPVLTFQTAGDLSVTYAANAQVGRLVRLDDKLVAAFFRVQTSAFTHTTASGDLQITGLSTAYKAAAETSFSWPGTLLWSGITKAGYTQVVPRIITATNTIVFSASGSGVAADTVVATDTPSGGTMTLVGSVIYEVE